MFLSSRAASFFFIVIIFNMLWPLSTTVAFDSDSNLSIQLINDQRLQKSGEDHYYNLNLLYQNKYHNLSEVYEELQHFNKSAPELIDYSHLGYSYYGNKIPLITLTNEKISEEYKSKTYIVAHHHAREMCTIEEVVRLIRDLVNEFGDDNETTSLLNRVIIYFIVTLNPDSLDYTLYQNEHFRKSMKPYDDDNDGLLDEDGPEDINNDGKISEFWIYNATTTDFITRWFEGYDRDLDGKIGEDPPGGVDLNRNYPFHWNDSTSDTGSTSDKTSFTYPGPTPFSENETRVLDNFVKRHNFTHALSLHSGIATLCYGWSWTEQYHQPEQAIYNTMANYIRNKNLLPAIFFPFNRIGYTCAGEWGDYMYSEYNIISMTLEIFGAADKSSLVLVDENTTHKTYERKFEDFIAFNPPSNSLENLHSDLLSFNKFWISLTPKITLSSITNKTLLNGDKEITLSLGSGSLYWNTTDNPKITVISSNQGLIKDYPEEIPTILPNNYQPVKIILHPDIQENISLQIVIRSNWASDLQLSLQITPEMFKQVRGFVLLPTFLTLVLIVFRRCKKRTNGVL
jgi:hypothetical protein